MNQTTTHDLKDAVTPDFRGKAKARIIKHNGAEYFIYVDWSIRQCIVTSSDDFEAFYDLTTERTIVDVARTVRCKLRSMETA